MSLTRYSLLPSSVTALEPSAVELLFRTWVLRALRDYVCDCLHVADCRQACDTLRPTANLLVPETFSPADLGKLLRHVYASCVGADEEASIDGPIELLYTGTRERALALRSLNDLITDVDFLDAARRDPFATSTELLAHARAVAWIGIEQTLIAGELLSPAVVLFEKLKRDREVRAQLGRQVKAA